jgi:hypothetical protein
MKNLFGILVMSMLICIQAYVVSAAPVNLNVGDNWQRFFWEDGIGSRILTGSQDDPGEGYTITTPEPIYINITDAFQTGDAFDIYVDGALLFSTPNVISEGTYITDPLQAFTNAAFSSGQFVLGAGTHTIDIFLRNARLGTKEGSGFIRAEPVPEPTTMLLFGTGIWCIAARYRKRRDSVL